MKIIQGSQNLKKHHAYPVLTMGNFDGLHKGHQKIIKTIQTIAKRNRGTSVVYTFDPHPVRILCPDLTPPLIQTLDQKSHMMDNLCVDLLIVEPFTKHLSHLTFQQFFSEIILKKIGAREIVIGYDFTFGQKRAGKIEDLDQLAKKEDIRVHTIDAVLQQGSLLSSTLIRHFIERGEITQAKSMLGHPYSITGAIIKGRGVGAELGYHTANLSPLNEIIPPPGVYITSTIIQGDGRSYPSVTNIGYNPTFGGTDLSIETYLIDYKSNLLRKKIELFFHSKIRREMTFESVDELRKQITTDVTKARQYHAKRISK